MSKEVTTFSKIKVMYFSVFKEEEQSYYEKSIQLTNKSI